MARFFYVKRMLGFLRKHWLSGIFILVIGFIVFDPSVTFAKPPTTGTGAKDTLKSMAAILSVIIKIFTFVALLIMSWGGELLGTTFITGPEAMEGIRSMWVFVRNITNIGFVLVLLYLSFANLFSFGEGDWSIKAKLPKLIFAMVAINFSLLGFKVVIDAVNVGTVAILSIADKAIDEKGGKTVKEMLESGTDESGNSCENPAKTGKCRYFYVWMNETMNDSGKPNDGLFRIDPDKLANMDESKNNYATRNLMLAFGVHFQNLEQLPKLAADLKDFSGVIENILFSSIMALAYLIALVCVFIALLARMLILWLAMVFSPLLIAAKILDLGEGSGDLGRQILTHLIMPLKIAAAFAISFVMISVMIDIKIVTHDDFITVGKQLEPFMGVNMAGFLWKILTVVIFWKAAFWAVEKSAAEGLINNIKSGAETVGSSMTKMATIDQPIFKTVDGKKISLSALGQIPQAINTMRTSQSNTMYNDMRNALGFTKLTDAMQKASDAIVKASGSSSSAIEFVNSTKSHKSQILDKTEVTARENFIAGLERQSAPEDFTKALRDKKNDVVGFKQIMKEAAMGKYNVDGNLQVAIKNFNGAKSTTTDNTSDSGKSSKYDIESTYNVDHSITIKNYKDRDGKDVEIKFDGNNVESANEKLSKINDKDVQTLIVNEQSEVLKAAGLKPSEYEIKIENDKLKNDKLKIIEKGKGKKEEGL